MPFRVQVGPPQIAIHQGQTVLVSEQDGQIVSPSEKGLYFLDTRVISAWSIYANGAPWAVLNGGAIAYYAARIFLTNGDFLTQDGPIAARTLSLVISLQGSGVWSCEPSSLGLFSQVSLQLGACSWRAGLSRARGE